MYWKCVLFWYENWYNCTARPASDSLKPPPHPLINMTVLCSGIDVHLFWRHKNIFRMLICMPRDYLFAIAKTGWISAEACNIPQEWITDQYFDRWINHQWALSYFHVLLKWEEYFSSKLLLLLMCNDRIIPNVDYILIHRSCMYNTFYISYSSLNYLNKIKNTGMNIFIEVGMHEEDATNVPQDQYAGVPCFTILEQQLKYELLF